jgi:hypothetical protein
MTEEDFVAEKNIKMDMVHGLDQISSRFQSVRDGLPELVKNSKDQYFRLGVEKKSDRQIVVLVSANKKNLAVLDFAGAKLGDFDGWEEWNSRTANRKEMSENIEAGFGNGGKSFMVRGCLDRASLCGYSDGKVNKKGFINNNPKLRYKTVTFKDDYKKLILNLSNPKFRQVLNEELKPFGITISHLPKEVQEALDNRKSFTIVTLNNVKEWKDKIDSVKERKIRMIPTDLMSHAQASLTIETCFVWVQVGNKLIYASPLEVSPLDPLEGMEDIAFVQIPTSLNDPATGEVVSLKERTERSGLKIFTSKRDLRLSDALKARNVVRIHNKRNIVANWSMADLIPTTASGFIYAKLVCEDLSEEHTDSATRMSLVDSDLTRALKHWTIQQLSEIVSKIQKMQADRESSEDRKKASVALDRIRELMEKFLEKDNQEDNLNHGDSDKIKKPMPLIKWGKRLDEIVLETSNTKILKIPRGAIIPLIIRGYENKNGNRLPLRSLPPLFISCKDMDAFDLEGKSSIKGLKEGKFSICFETGNGSIKSNNLDVEVIEAADIETHYKERKLKQGEHLKIDLICIKKDNTKSEGLFFETYIDEEDMGKIDRSGNFIAGGIEGNATIRIKFGEGETMYKRIVLSIGKEKENKDKGSNIPYIMLCGDIAPGRESLPEEQRTVVGGDDYPTIMDYEPVWMNEPPSIIWINHRSKEAKKVRSLGTEGRLASMKSKTFQDFLLVKCFEILKRLKLKQKIGETQVTNIEFMQKLAQSEIESSGFLDLAQQTLEHLMRTHNEETD